MTSRWSAVTKRRGELQRAYRLPEKPRIGNLIVFAPFNRAELDPVPEVAMRQDHAVVERQIVGKAVIESIRQYVGPVQVEPGAQIVETAAEQTRAAMKETERAKRTGESVTLMILDVDHFKDVNDTLGHHVGDELLRVIGERISGSVRTEDTVARLGGDEFAIIQVGLNYPTDADVQAQRILHAMAEPVHVGNHKLIPMGSIGITVFPSDADNAQKLQQNADLAMYRAKQDQRSSYRFFDADLNSISERRTFLEKQLRNAIDAEELAVFFQPKVSICDGKPVGAEALLRWPHPEQGM